MQTASELAIKRVMDAYGLLVRLFIEDERAARERVSAFLASSKLTDENQLAVAGVKFLRASRERK